MEGVGLRSGSFRSYTATANGTTPAMVDGAGITSSGTLWGGYDAGSLPLPLDRVVQDNLDRVAIVNAELVAEANVRNDLKHSVLVATGPPPDTH